MVRTEPDLEDADNIKIDRRSARTYGAPLVNVGYGSGAASGLRVLDSRDGRPMFEIPLDGHPESFVAPNSSTRIFINVPTAGYIAVADSSRRRVTDKWPVQGFRDFFPMALDEADARIFIASRTPPALLVFDANSGKMVAHVNAVGDADDLYYDPANKRVYMTGGDGSIGVFEQRGGDEYLLLSKLPSAPQARTSLFVPETNRLYVAAPSNAGKPARVLVYEPRFVDFTAPIVGRRNHSRSRPVVLCRQRRSCLCSTCLRQTRRVSGHTELRLCFRFYDANKGRTYAAVSTQMPLKEREMSDRRKLFVSIAGFMTIVIGGSLFVWQQKPKKDVQPPAENTITGNDLHAGEADPQHQADYLIKMGDKMMGDGDYGSARSYYEAASKLAPSNTTARAGVESADRAMADDSTNGRKN